MCIESDQLILNIDGNGKTKNNFKEQSWSSYITQYQDLPETEHSCGSMILIQGNTYKLMNGLESPDTDILIYGHLIYDKDDSTTQ